MEIKTSVPQSQEGAVKADEQIDDHNDVTEEDTGLFLNDVLGPIHSNEARHLNRETEIKAKWEDKSVNPSGKVLHPSVEEQYFTDGGKEVKAVHDVVGSLWHVEFIPGGQVPLELKGTYTDERKCRHDIKQYLAKRV